MTELKAQIEESAKLLTGVWTLVQGASLTTLPAKCYEHWTRKAALYQALHATGGLFPAREKAWEAVKAVGSSVNVRDASRNVVVHGNIEMDFAIARHLTLTSYVTVVWSIYDRLSNICGRLAAISDLSENPKQNPKAVEDFLGKKDTLEFGAHVHLQHAYAWPLRVTYKLRNWLVHEGYEEGGTPMFRGDQIADGFALHEDAVAHLQKCCNYSQDDGKIDTCCLRAAEESWQTRDLLRIYEVYHNEIDTMFACLVKWSADSFIGQIAAFTARDKAALAFAAGRRAG